MRQAGLILILLGILAGGCGGPVDSPPGGLGPEDYGKLPGLKAAPDKNLSDELARIEEEGGTPEQLNRTKVAEADNVAAGLVGLFPEDKVASILAKSEAIFPPGRFELNPIDLQKAISLRKQYDAQRQAAREALARPGCDFGIQFMAGFTAELKFVDVVQVCARLEAFRAAESLDESLTRGDPDEAIQSLSFMLRLAHWLAAEKCVEARLQAAYLRTEAFCVLQAIVDHEKVTRADLDRLYELVQAQLSAWPDDARAWIGDRAMGLHAYEVVRDGAATSLLTPEEVDQFDQEGILRELNAAAVRVVNQDELYYMRTMREVIGSCARPFYARTELFDSIANELQEKRNSADYPIVAARLLLPDIREAHATQAQDRANWEAWALGLALATGRKPPPYEVNPLTGKKYRRANLDRFVEIGNIGTGQEGDNPSIIVPVGE